MVLRPGVREEWVELEYEGSLSIGCVLSCVRLSCVGPLRFPQAPTRARVGRRDSAWSWSSCAAPRRSRATPVWPFAARSSAPRTHAPRTRRRLSRFGDLSLSFLLFKHGPRALSLSLSLSGTLLYGKSWEALSRVSNFELVRKRRRGGTSALSEYMDPVLKNRMHRNSSAVELRQHLFRLTSYTRPTWRDFGEDSKSSTRELWKRARL